MPHSTVESTHGARIAVHPLADAPAATEVVVFCHALGFCAPMYAPLARALGGRYRCLGIDLRFHGSSTAPSEPSFAWREFGDDVLAVLDSPLVGEGVVVHGFGHSLGGAALTLASARRPGRLRSLYLYEPIVPPPDVLPPEGAPNAMAAMTEKRRARFESREAAGRNFASKPPFSTFDPDALAGYVDDALGDDDDGAVSLRCRPAWEANLYRTAGASGAWDAAARIGTRVRVAMGVEAPGEPSAFAARTAARMGAGEPRRFPDRAHFGPFEAPGAIADDLREWLARTE